MVFQTFQVADMVKLKIDTCVQGIFFLIRYLFRKCKTSRARNQNVNGSFVREGEIISLGMTESDKRYAALGNATRNDRCRNTFCRRFRFSLTIGLEVVQGI